MNIRSLTMSAGLALLSTAVFAADSERAWVMTDVKLPQVEQAEEGRARSGEGRVTLVKPVSDANPISILMIPGGGLSAQQYLRTPDGRDGWALQFAEAGHSVYLLNTPQVDLAAEPDEGGYAQESVWALWGFGPEYGVAYEDSQHPLDAIDQLDQLLKLKGSAPPQAVTRELINQIGDVVILGHSAGGRPTFQLAAAHPELVRGVIVVEPVPCPTDEQALKNDFVDLGRPMLSVWGDNLDRGRPSMQARYDSCVQAAEIISSLDGNAQTFDLPAMGIPGNSHLLMQDLNSEEIGSMLLDWIREEVALSN